MHSGGRKGGAGVGEVSPVYKIRTQGRKGTGTTRSASLRSTVQSSATSRAERRSGHLQREVDALPAVEVGPRSSPSHLGDRALVPRGHQRRRQLGVPGAQRRRSRIRRYSNGGGDDDA